MSRGGAQGRCTHPRAFPLDPVGDLSDFPGDRHVSLVGGIHRQISGDDGEDTLVIACRDRAGNHPGLTTTRIEVRGRLGALVHRQWHREPILRLDVVGRYRKVEGVVAVGRAIEVGASGDCASLIQ